MNATNDKSKCFTRGILKKTKLIIMCYKYVFLIVVDTFT